MSDQDDIENSDSSASRRRFLMLGAVSASAVVTIRPALAQTAGSVLNCQIPAPVHRRGSEERAALRL
jgi:hypothetical protein